MAAAFKSVANNQTQISVLRLTSKSSWVWFAIARIKNCNQTFGNEAEKQLCFSFLKSFMVQLSSCIIVAKKVSYCMIGQARSFAPVVLCLSLHCCVRSSLRDWIGAGQEDQTFLSLEQMPSLWKMKWIYNSIIIFQLVCCCSLVLCWIFLSTFSLNKFHRWDLASKSHTKSFIEEVLRWEIDLDGKHFREKPTNQKDLSQFLISGMRRRSSGEVAAKKVMTSIFSCWGRIALTVALLGWHFMSTLSARSVFHEQPETMNNDKKKHVHCTIFGVQHNVLAFLRPTRKNVLKPRA